MKEKTNDDKLRTMAINIYFKLQAISDSLPYCNNIEKTILSEINEELTYDTKYIKAFLIKAILAINERPRDIDITLQALGLLSGYENLEKTERRRKYVIESPYLKDMRKENYIPYDELPEKKQKQSVDDLIKSEKKLFTKLANYIVTINDIKKYIEEASNFYIIKDDNSPDGIQVKLPEATYEKMESKKPKRKMSLIRRQILMIHKISMTKKILLFSSIILIIITVVAVGYKTHNKPAPRPSVTLEQVINGEHHTNLMVRNIDNGEEDWCDFTEAEVGQQLEFLIVYSIPTEVPKFASDSDVLAKIYLPDNIEYSQGSTAQYSFKNHMWGISSDSSPSGTVPNALFYGKGLKMGDYYESQFYLTTFKAYVVDKNLSNGENNIFVKGEVNTMNTSQSLQAQVVVNK